MSSFIKRRDRLIGGSLLAGLALLFSAGFWATLGVAALGMLLGPRVIAPMLYGLGRKAKDLLSGRKKLR